MTEYIKINGGEHVHLSDVKRLRTISDSDRTSLASLGDHVDADRFNTRIDHANNSTSYAPETVADIAEQGVALVQVDKEAFVPKDNINRTRDLTEQDRQDFEQKTGRVLRSDFKSQIETRAGRVLATVDSGTVMRRMSQPYQPNGPAAPQQKEPDGSGREVNEQQQNLAQIRDALKENTGAAAVKVKADQVQAQRPHEPNQ